jgi:PPOX class probable F420-dependent enzyme
MSLGTTLTGLTNRFYDAVRHPDAHNVPDAPAGSDFSSLEGRKYAILETFKKSGEGVPTAVWFGVADGRLYVNSERDVWKIKRIRNNPRVRVAPSDSRGKPLGPAVAGTARIVEPSSPDGVAAEAAIAANYGAARRLYEGVGHRLGIDNVYIEVVPGEAE